MSPDQPPRWYFESPLDRGALRARAGVAMSFAFVLAFIAAGSFHAGSIVGPGLGVVGALGFVLAAGLTWRMAHLERAPLVLDERGLEVDDGLGTRWRLAWTDVADVRIARSLWGRRVVLEVRAPQGVMARVLPRLCQGDGPPEWTAGLIQTFRNRALHPEVPEPRA